MGEAIIKSNTSYMHLALRSSLDNATFDGNQLINVV